MSGLDEWVYLALLIILITHFIGAITAFGSSLMAVPPLLMLYGAESLSDIVFVLIVVGLMQSTMLAVQNWKQTDVRICVLLLGGSALGLPLGMNLVSALPEKAIMLVLGIFTLAAGLTSGLSDLERKNALSRIWAVPFAILSGVMQGAFASGGTILVTYAQRALPRRDAFRATLAVYWTILNIGFVTMLSYRMKPNSEDWTLSGVAGVFVLLVTLFADRCAKRIERRIFQRGVSGMLVISGCLILVSQLMN